MKTVTVSASKEYDVIIGSGVLQQLDKYVQTIKQSCKIAIISDTNVAPLYMDTIRNILNAAGYPCCSYVFSAGESSKNGNTYLSILEFVAQNKLTRSDLIIALGGGVVGDMAGFTAATYLRGVDYIQIPTTLLAMVDSSVGGKTAIDLPSGKNLAGAFYQPRLVLCDIDTLSTLPDSIFIDGCAEVLKYGILFDVDLWHHLQINGVDFNREYIISRCVELKRDIVCEDEFDTGKRQLLNLGHTIGHGIEAVSNFSISHGNAVAIGTSAISKIAVNLKLLEPAVYNEIIDTLVKFRLPVKTVYTADVILPYMLGDKKRSGAQINLIVPNRIGNCTIMLASIEQLESLLKAGL